MEVFELPWAQIGSMITVIVMLSPLIKPIRHRLGDAFGDMFTKEVVASVKELTAVVEKNYQESKTVDAEIAKDLKATQKQTTAQNKATVKKLSELVIQCNVTNEVVDLHTKQLEGLTALVKKESQTIQEKQ